MVFEPHFDNLDSSGHRIDVNGFGEKDYALPGDGYGHLENNTNKQYATIRKNRGNKA